jgi:hypothetical protein
MPPVAHVSPGLTYKLFRPRSRLSPVFRSANYVDNGMIVGHPKCGYVPIALKKDGEEGWDHFVVEEEKAKGLLNSKNIRLSRKNDFSVHDQNVSSLWSNTECIWEHDEPRLREGLQFSMAFLENGRMGTIYNSASKCLPPDAWKFKVEKNRLISLDARMPGSFSYTLSVFNWLVMDLENKTLEPTTLEPILKPIEKASPNEVTTQPNDRVYDASLLAAIVRGTAAAL